MIGKVISHYKIIGKLGEGGMGEVFLAEDNELDRKVALKFLPSQYSATPEVKSRFKREAKAAAALNHSNIITVYGIGEHDEKAFIVMEYVAGESLKDLLSRAELDPDKAIQIAIQICEGLSEAHQAGVVHRDIKPDNILLDTKGRIKIADFGLAKLQNVTNLTQETTTMGTLNYMSPEQVKGSAIDNRSDIFSLGVVLYEMLSGQVPFKGNHFAAISYSIIHEEPVPLSEYDPEISPLLQNIIDKILAKNPVDRYQDIAEVSTELKTLISESTIQSLVETNEKKISRVMKWAWIALTIVFSVMLAIFIFDKYGDKSPHQSLATHKQLTFSGIASYPAISPDGKFLTYISGELESDGNVPAARVMLKDLSGGNELEIYSGSFIGNHGWGTLKWSPDGSKILFTGDDGSYIIPMLGGDARMIGFSSRACWSPDGLEIASAIPKRILISTLADDSKRTISLTGNFNWISALDWSPVGNRLLVLTTGPKRHTIRTINTDGSQQQIVVDESVELKAPHWSSDGEYIHYFRSNAETKDLLKIRVNPASGELKGSPILLQTGLRTGDVSSISNDGKRLFYTRGQVASNLWLVSVNSEKSKKKVHTKQLTTGTSWIRQPMISPDGSNVAYSIGSHPRANIFTLSVKEGKQQQVTYFDSYCSGPVWSPDGKKIAFGSTEGDKPKVWTVIATGSTPRSFQKSKIADNVYSLNWYSDNIIIYKRPGNRNFHILNTRTQEEKALLPDSTQGWKFSARISPDGEKAAIYWNRFRPRGSRGIWLISLNDTSKTLLYPGYAFPITWSLDGKWLYAYEKGDKPHKILKLSSNTGEKEIHLTLPFEWLDSWSGPTITPDGKQTICAVAVTQSDIWLMENFDPHVN